MFLELLLNHILTHFLNSMHLNPKDGQKWPMSSENSLHRRRMPELVCRRLYSSALPKQENCLWTLTPRSWPRSGRWTAWPGWIWKSHLLEFSYSRNRTPWRRTTRNCRWGSFQIRFIATRTNKTYCNYFTLDCPILLHLVHVKREHQSEGKDTECFWTTGCAACCKGKIMSKWCCRSHCI